MQLTRIYQPVNLAINSTIALNEIAFNHVIRVLRLPIGAKIKLFNGKGGEFTATIVAIEKRQATVDIEQHEAIERESSLFIHLGQAISRGEKMDFTIQKAVELGVNKITPLFTDYCNVKLDAERVVKRLEHWRAVVISACEQCGRNQIPEIMPPQTLINWLPQCTEKLKLLLDPDASQSLATISLPVNEVCLLIGSEGGLSDSEIALSKRHDFQSMQLGPRILRTETAALAAITALQTRWGDFSSLHYA